MIAETQSNDGTEVLISIRSFIWSKGGRPSQWYVGVSADPERRLFKDHGVQRADDNWTYQRAFSPGHAQRIADYFVTALGTSGNAQRLMRGPAFVYAYRRGAETRP